MSDPLDGIEPLPLSEQIAPYRKYGDTELAITLLGYEKQHGGPGLPPAPANHGPDYYCTPCGENVKGTSGRGAVLRCPLCGETPGMLTLGKGPR